MRQPTSDAVAYAWWRAALAGDPVAVHEDEPQAGFFKSRLAYRGPFFPASIWIEGDVCPDTGELLSDERFACEVNGARRDPFEQWQYLAKRPVTRAEYDELKIMARELA